jgi:hypothetical protein
MIWFGSSAGVALSNMFHETKSVISYLRYGWHIGLAYVVGFGILLAIMGWHPVEKRGKGRSENIMVPDRGLSDPLPCKRERVCFTLPGWPC